MIQAEDARIIQDSQLHPSVSNCNQEEPEFKDVEDSEDELFDEETREGAGLGGADVDSVLCAYSQPENVTRDPPLLVFPDATSGFWSKKKKGLRIEEVVHNDNASIDAILTQHGILSLKDLWHKCKNIMSKFKEVLQEKRRTPSDCSMEAATTIAQVVVFSIQQLKDFCKENGQPAHDIAYKLKSWIYMCAKNAVVRRDTTPKMLTVDVQNAADHWASNHDTCWTLLGLRKCVLENWPQGRDCKYPEGGETHKHFLKKYLTESKMKFHLRARENFISETFHSVINKYATKCIHFDASHTARLACATLD
ncbi:hypothetical protein R1flu_008837 [Riccia fluitans]|uniref:Transposase n=1 Tax=Riccia fluitans TaxID=41844 RepID=A0ABD1Z0C3_9MARC